MSRDDIYKKVQGVLVDALGVDDDEVTPTAKTTAAGASFKATGTVGEKQALQARVELAYFNLADKEPELAGVDAKLSEHNRARWNVLQQGKVVV